MPDPTDHPTPPADPSLFLMGEPIEATPSAFFCPNCASDDVNVRDHAGHGQSDHFRPDPGMTSLCQDCGHEWSTKPRGDS